MLKSTPAPWKVKGNKITYYDRKLKHELTLAEVTGADLSEEYTANARLMASAPNLLQALIYILGTEHTTDGRPLPDDIRDMARIAVNVAVGEEGA